MSALKKLTANMVYAVRDGKDKQVDVSTLVIGDIVKVVAGEKVPADLRIIKSSDLKVNNASLTGENVDVKIGPDANHQELTEAKNIARTGCNFTSGSATAIVIAIGDYTFFGQIAKSTTTIERPETLIKKEINRLIHTMAIFASVLGIVFFILARFNGYSWVESTVFFIGIVVANVPEGLLPQITVALTLTAQRMLAKGVLVNNLEIIETLGAVTIICSDKTGTLTQNRMTVTHLVYNKEIFKNEHSPHLDGDSFRDFDKNDLDFQALQRIATLNTDAKFLTHEANVFKRETKGDASEAAMIKFVDPIRDIEHYREACKRHCAIPFNSTNKWMLSVTEQEDASKPIVVLMKGAPERILMRCTSILLNNQVVPMTAELKQEMETINEQLATRGERVLGFAQLELPAHLFPKDFKFDADGETPNFPTDKLTMVGFMSMIDPPRPSVKPAIKSCNNAGVKVFMVTGDHPTTAAAIAKSLNIIQSPTL